MEKKDFETEIEAIKKSGEKISKLKEFELKQNNELNIFLYKILRRIETI